MKESIKDLPASIRAQLQNKAKEINCSFAEILQYYGMERFLYRFSKSEYVDKFILKGALLFMAWRIPERRATLDIDFLARLSDQIIGIEKMIKDICKMAVTPDGLIFNPETVKGQRIKEGADYEGVRVKFTGFLERSRIPMQVDVGFGDIVYPKAETIDYPAILDLPRPHLKGYPIESIISEKLEAIIKLGSLNSRMKDFYDIWIMIRRFKFDDIELAYSLKKTFEHRKTSLPNKKPLFAEEIYNEKSDRQILWRAFLKKEAINFAPDNLSVAAFEIEKFIVGLL